jgi:uncharacterized BrkB/YihY/UPF0761 family membrane protein
MKKTPYVKAPVEFPLSRNCRILGLFMVILSTAAAVVALALILWFGLLLLDESAIVEIPGPVWEAALPVVWAALGVLAVSSVLIALCTRCGRRRADGISTTQPAAIFSTTGLPTGKCGGFCATFPHGRQPP